MVSNQEDRIQTSIKNLSNESKALLGELERMSAKAADLISHLYASLRKDGLDPQDARRLIEQKIAVSDRTLRRALPEEAKTMIYANKPKPKKAADRMSASNARLVLDDEEPKIPPPEQHIIEPEPEQEQEKELVHRTIRITMSARKLLALSKHMATTVEKEGMETNYAIEYDYVDKELYVDVTEEWETKLMVND
jgi:hypothetical protein